MARTSTILDDDLQERKRRTAEIVKRLRTFIGGRNKLDRTATFIETLVATILSQNTSDANSARAYRALREAYPSWQQLAGASQSELASVIRSGGLADQKARTIIDVMNVVQERYGGFEPKHFETASDDEILNELTALKGVGLKTAACVLMFSLERDICAVDTHIHRVVNRLGIVHGANPDKTFHALRQIMPRGKARQFHVDLILFGRRTCKAQRPHCYECPVFDLCAWDQKQAYADAALPGPAPVSGDLLLLDMFPERTVASKTTRSPRP